MPAIYNLDIGTVYLRDVYAIDYTCGNKTIGDEYPTGTVAQRVTDAGLDKYPWWIAYCTCDSARSGIALPNRIDTPGAPKWTDEQILKCSSFVAAHNNTVWATGGGINHGWYFGAPPLSRVNITWDIGSYYANHPLMMVYGCYSGHGPGNSSPDLYEYVVIAGAGTTGANGVYRIGAWINGRASFSKTDWLISWNGLAWVITKTGGGGLGDYYKSTDNVLRPYDATTWVANLGVGPVPTVTSGDWDLIDDDIHAGTRISIWHEEWLDIVGGDDGPLKHILQTINYPVMKDGVLYAGVLGATCVSTSDPYDPIWAVLNNYMEGCMVKNVRLNGRRIYAPEAENGGYNYVKTYEDGGVVAWRLGSVSKMEDIHADDFNNAPYMFCSGVPGNFYNLRGMFSNFAGMWIRGDATIGVYGFECDECPTAYRAEGYPDPTNPTGWLIPPGVTLSAHNTKIETGTSNSWPIGKGTMLFDGVGWCVCSFLGVGYAGANGVSPEGLCRIEPYPANFGSTNSYIFLTGLKTFGYVRTLVHHVDGADSRKWFMDKGEYTLKFDSTVHGFVYNSANGGSLSIDSGEGVMMKNITYVNRMQPTTYPPADGTWDDTTGLPALINPAI